MIKKCIYVILVVFLFTMGTCFSSPQVLSADDLKTIQVRKYDKFSSNKLMKATLNVLQNNYYFIDDVDSQLGCIVASREFDTRDKNINIKDEFGYSEKFSGIKRFLPISPSYAKTEASVNVTGEDGKSTIRISFRKKLFNLYDAAIKVEDVIDNGQYDKFYSELDKELQIKNVK